MNMLLQPARNTGTGKNLGKRKAVTVLLLMSVPVYVVGFFFNYVPIWGWIMAFIDYSPRRPDFPVGLCRTEKFPNAV